jgi:hypothetical protein
MMKYLALSLALISTAWTYQAKAETCVVNCYGNGHCVVNCF